jgi:hypothetical protein
MQQVFSVSKPIVVNGEAVIFVQVFDHVLRLAWDDKNRTAANLAVGACSAFFDMIEGARPTWYRKDEQ